MGSEDGISASQPAAAHLMGHAKTNPAQKLLANARGKRDVLRVINFLLVGGARSDYSRWKYFVKRFL